MGSCKYCGESAGLLSSAHKECRDAYDTARGSVTDLLNSGLGSSVSGSGLKRSVQEVAASGRLPAGELRTLVLSSMVRCIDNALSDHILSHEEEKRLEELTDAFDIEWADLDEVGYNYKDKLVKGLILRDLSEGKIPKGRVNLSGDTLPISLGKGEAIIWVFLKSEYHKLHTRSQYVGGSTGMSVRLMKGVYLRSSDYQGERIQTSELQSAGPGYLIVTTKNVFFYGSEIVKISLKKIVGVQPLTDGIGIHKEGQNAKPMYFKLDDPFYAANLISLANSLT
jgi:hypothetical protein